VTHSGPAGSPEGDGALPTRRELRARREAADLAAGTASQDSAVVAAPVLPTPAVPTPAAPAATDLALIVQSSLPAASATATPSARNHQTPARPARAYARSTPTPPTNARTRPTGRVRASRKPLAKLLTLVAIPAIFLTTALPSYAFAPAGAVTSISAQRSGVAQSVSVAAAAVEVSISADGFSATSQAEIDALEAQEKADRAAEEAARSAAAGFAVYGIRAEGDDYPWPTAATDDQGGGLSPLGYYYRECVDFVAWRLNRDAGATGSPWKWTWGKLTPGGGNGSAWASGWAAKGWPTGNTPVVGAVASFSYNHVAYVQSVPGDGTVVLEEYNWMGSHAYHTRTVPISDVKLFLYPPT
jgi:hypothetical protein